MMERMKNPVFNPFIRARDWKGAAGYLSDGNKDIRRNAARALAEIGDPDAAGALIAAISDPDAWVRLDIVRALGKLRAPDALDTLAAMLHDQNMDIRMEVLHALGCIRDLRVAQPLLQALKDPHQEIRSGAAAALDMIGWRPSRDQERVLLLMAKKRWVDLLQINEIPIESVWESLREREEYVRLDAIEALGATGDARVADFLLLGFTDPSRAVRISALQESARFPSFDPDSFAKGIRKALHPS